MTVEFDSRNVRAIGYDSVVRLIEEGRIMLIKLPQKLTAIGDIERDFPNHWILIDRPQMDAAGKVTAGYLVMASQDPKILYEKAAELKLADCAFRSTKKEPKDLRFLL